MLIVQEHRSLKEGHVVRDPVNKIFLLCLREFALNHLCIVPRGVPIVNDTLDLVGGAILNRNLRLTQLDLQIMLPPMLLVEIIKVFKFLVQVSGLCDRV